MSGSLVIISLEDCLLLFLVYKQYLFLLLTGCMRRINKANDHTNIYWQDPGHDENFLGGGENMKDEKYDLIQNFH